MSDTPEEKRQRYQMGFKHGWHAAANVAEQAEREYDDECDEDDSNYPYEYRPRPDISGAIDAQIARLFGEARETIAVREARKRLVEAEEAAAQAAKDLARAEEAVRCARAFIGGASEEKAE